MDIASWIIVGLVTGSIARLAMPGPAAGGMPVAILIGLVGAFIGGVAGDNLLAGHGGSRQYLRLFDGSHWRDDSPIPVSLCRNAIRGKPI